MLQSLHHWKTQLKMNAGPELRCLFALHHGSIPQSSVFYVKSNFLYLSFLFFFLSLFTVQIFFYFDQRLHQIISSHFDLSLRLLANHNFTLFICSSFLISFIMLFLLFLSVLFFFYFFFSSFF